MTETKIITKASGEEVLFDRDKLIKSLTKSMADKSVIDIIVDEVERHLKNGMTTREIYNLAFSKLKKYSSYNAARYKLKRAIFELGPTGFPFEKFVAEIFKALGFSIKTNQIISGKCVQHEVDVLAENEKELNMMECKFHNRQGVVCEIKTALYVSARFQDIEKVRTNDKIFKGWLVTNTKLSSDAIQYSTCAGLQLMGWNYPEDKSLKKYIDIFGLHPTTSLTTMTMAEKQDLLDKGYVLCRHIYEFPEILNEAKINSRRRERILSEVRHLCNEIK